MGCAMVEAVKENVPLSLLRHDPNILHLEQPRFNCEDYSLKKVGSFTPEAAKLLLQIHPIHVVRIRRLYVVVAGHRTYQIAAFCFDPNYEIPVLVLNKRTQKQQIALLRYLDLVVSPLLFRLEGSLAVGYLATGTDTNSRDQTWLAPYNSSMNKFADLLGVSPSALCTPKKQKVDL